ncbi:leucine-rich repeat-containing protein 49 isoform X2 [Cimex lectularius]|uniref:Leucine-rich repeat-containing protein 49 n=1 Tax=Cimex lectularius TaxID=79782 RepID=A0A8I6RYH9_CIMLE|nr:leucine-rich repeat-containing protein 49 isoform X2 [Cimex lectularius]
MPRYVKVSEEAESDIGVETDILQYTSSSKLPYENNNNCPKITGSKPRSKSKEINKAGDYLIEINGNVLSVFGHGALKFIDRPWNPLKARDVTTVKFSSLDFNFISAVLNRVKHRFLNAEHFHFSDTNIYCLGQLNALADIQGLTSLTIEPKGNPVTKKNWRSYAIYRLSHWGLKTINNQQITPVELTSSDLEFRGLSNIVISCLPDNLLEPLLERLQLNQTITRPREWLDLAEPSIRTVVAKEALQWRKTKQEYSSWREKGRIHLQKIISSTLTTVLKLKQLNVEWSSILREIVRDTLVDYSHFDSYMKQCISQIKA